MPLTEVFDDGDMREELWISASFPKTYRDVLRILRAYLRWSERCRSPYMWHMLFYHLKLSIKNMWDLPHGLDELFFMSENPKQMWYDCGDAMVNDVCLREQTIRALKPEIVLGPGPVTQFIRNGRLTSDPPPVHIDFHPALVPGAHWHQFKKLYGHVNEVALPRMGEIDPRTVLASYRDSHLGTRHEIGPDYRPRPI
jgi:hypothetical protein